MRNRAPLPSISANGESIRRFGNAAPALAPLPQGLDLSPATLMRDHMVAEAARRLREWHDAVYEAAITPMRALAQEVKAKLDAESDTLDEPFDPDGIGAASLEAAEVHFRTQLCKLRPMRNDIAHYPQVVAEFDRLLELYASVISNMQDLRWSVLIADGIPSPSDMSERRFANGAELIAALEEDDDKPSS